MSTSLIFFLLKGEKMKKAVGGALVFGAGLYIGYTAHMLKIRSQFNKIVNEIMNTPMPRKTEVVKHDNDKT